MCSFNSYFSLSSYSTRGQVIQQLFNERSNDSVVLQSQIECTMFTVHGNYLPYNSYSIFDSAFVGDNDYNM
jgi:hypothetical protein